jgi:YD repeat-containing protein
MLSKNNLCLFFSFFLLIQMALSQGGQIPAYQLIKQINETGSGPEKSSLSRSIENPINLSTGGVNFEIPLYEIKVNDYNLPIKLNYRSNGFKVSEMSSNIGMGWNLEAGGMIIRTIKGQRDELNYNGYTSDAGSILYQKLSDGQLPDPDVNLDGFLSEFQALLYTCDGLYDSEPDIYSFSFGDYSGSFIFDHYGEIHFIPQQNFKITPTRIGNSNIGQSDHILSFEIITDDGVVYTFGSMEENSNYREETLAESYAFYSGLESEYNVTATYYEKKYITTTSPDVAHDEHYSAWLLKKIRLTDGDEINFEYVLDEVFTYIGTDETYHAWYSGNPPDNNGLGSYNPDDPYVVSRYNKFRTANIPRISRIYWNQGEVVFMPASQTREDVNDFLPAKRGYAIDKIIVNHNTQTIKEVEFEQSYFDYVGGSEYQFNPSYFKRLRLDSLKVNDQHYAFNYYCSDMNDLGGLFFPSRNTAAVDLWGYFKKYPDWFQTPKVVKPRIYCYPDDKDHPLYQSIYSVWPRTNYEGDEYIFDSDFGNNLDPQLSSAIVGMLKTVELPTGGSLEYEYELNDFVIDGNESQGGGVRVSKISKTSSLDAEAIVTIYSYLDENGRSSGRISSVPDFAKNNYYATIQGWGHYLDDLEKYSIRTSRQYSTVSDMHGVNGSSVNYLKVTKIDEGNGRTEYNYNLPFTAETSEVLVNNESFIKKADILRTTYYQAPEYPNVPEELLNLQHIDGASHLTDPLTGWLSGYLNSVVSFDINGDTIQKKAYKYVISPDPYSRVFYVQSKYNAKTVMLWDVLTEEQTVGGEFEMFEYDIIWGVNHYRTGNLLLADIITYNYTTDNNSVVTDITKNEYYNIPDKYGYLSRQTKFNSDEIVSSTSYLYPFNYPNEYSAVTDQMKMDNMLNVPLEVIYWKDSKVSNAQFTKYGFFGDFIRPSEIYELEVNEPLTAFVPSNTYNTFQMDSHYTKETGLTFSEETCKLQEVISRTTPTISYLWGYTNTLPIAKIENAGYEEVRTELTSMGYSVENLQTQTDTQLRVIFQSLRNRPAMKDAMITSYTHKPLVGMTSETDPSGKTTFYEYDYFGRLQYIKNHDGHYIKEYKYHYGEDEQTNSIESK